MKTYLQGPGLTDEQILQLCQGVVTAQISQYAASIRTKCAQGCPINNRTLIGPPGITGPLGDPGKPVSSDMFPKNNHIKSLYCVITSSVIQGKPGKVGAKGERGPPGIKGLEGQKGAQGDRGLMEHYNRNLNLPNVHFCVLLPSLVYDCRC